MPELVATYSTALLALGVLTLLMVVQATIAGIVKNVISGQPAGVTVRGNIEHRTFRVVRSHENSVENFSALMAASLLAMIAGASPTWVTYLVVAAVVLRLLHWVFYVMRIGPDAGGPRTIAYVLGLLINLALAIMAIIALM
ncbi:MAPEG family protein [Paramylibacter kogurei]|nr:MAPEG family protein [Amylibacter kogurei]